MRYIYIFLVNLRSNTGIELKNKNISNFNFPETNNLTVFNNYCLAVLRGEDTSEEPDNSGRIEELADKLENGDYGNGRDTRAERTAQDGYTLEEYEAAQLIVNERS